MDRGKFWTSTILYLDLDYFKVINVLCRTRRPLDEALAHAAIATKVAERPDSGKTLPCTQARVGGPTMFADPSRTALMPSTARVIAGDCHRPAVQAVELGAYTLGGPPAGCSIGITL